MKKGGIVVVGSANIDMAVTVDRSPEPGETVFGNTFGMFPGGKGANQAVAAAKLGSRVAFIGKMGSDLFRERLCRSMAHDGVNLEYALRDRALPTGTALITVDGCGQNRIIVASGSNMALMPGDVSRRRRLFASSSVTLLQLEIPIATVLCAARLAKSCGHLLILNPAPAPAQKLPERLLALVDFLTPNEVEAEALSGIRVNSVSSAVRAGEKLLSAGAGNVIVTMGAKGSVLVARGRTKLFPPLRVRTVDSTAAGDAFNGALASSLAAHKGLDEAIAFANCAAALSVTRRGAQSSLPVLREVNKLFKQWRHL